MVAPMIIAVLVFALVGLDLLWLACLLCLTYFVTIAILAISDSKGDR